SDAERPAAPPPATGMERQAAAEPTAAPGAESPVAAHAPTMAPAATAVAEMAAAPAEPASAGVAVDAEAVPGEAPRPPAPHQPAPIPVNQQQLPAIKAGEVDDNLNFDDYMAYLRSYQGPPAVQVDVGERYILSVVNEQQQPVLDARVRVYDGQALIFEGRTYAGGRTILFPRALGISQNSSELRVTVEKGNSAVEGVLRRGPELEQSFVLRGAQALPQRPRLDVLFLLDATGSMGDEIDRIQQTIASIVERIDRIQPRPELRLAVVAYRDRGDEYVTRTYADFTPDVAAFREALLQVRADGGGDTPEDLNEALLVALRQLSWADDAVRLTFLVADAPPHLDYGQQFTYTHGARAAVASGIKIYPIAASNTDAQAEYVFRQLAQQTLARFIFLTYQPGQNSGAPGETTQMNVDPAEFTVERLDDLVVRIVEREMAEAAGVG
ncbi:MAG TPA: vWA domain-containing protein, partial [Roseiflexaceae bacterium]|nr:vWA domain-containing protein [Roseiflexaceae bacterium]